MTVATIEDAIPLRPVVEILQFDRRRLREHAMNHFEVNIHPANVFSRRRSNEFSLLFGGIVGDSGIGINVPPLYLDAPQ